MTIDTFNNIELIARPLFNPDAPFPLDQSFNGNMAVFTFDLLVLLPMMAFCTILLKCLSVVFAWGMAVRTFHPVACYMGVMGKFNIVEGNGPSLHANMAEGRTGQISLELPGLVTSVDCRQSLFGLIISRIEEFEGIFNIMSAFTQQDEAVIMACLIEKVLGFFKLLGLPFIPLKIV